MEVVKANLDRVLLIKPDVFEDFRGFNVETYNKELYQKNGIDVEFIHDNISVSRQNVLRGIHGDNETWKLISCLYGSFYLAVVNCDSSSANFGKWQAFVLSDVNRHQVLVPPKYGNGHLALTPFIVSHYKQSAYYNPQGQFSYRFDEPKFNIWWPVKNPILSQRDEGGR